MRDALSTVVSPACSRAAFQLKVATADDAPQKNNNPVS